MAPKFKVGDVIRHMKYVETQHIILEVKDRHYELLPIRVQILEHVLGVPTIADIKIVDALGRFERRATKAEMVLYVP